MKIPVLPHHISQGNVSAEWSPIALAIREATKTDKTVKVWHGHVSFTDAAGRQSVYAVPPEVDEAERVFFLKGEMTPFTFILKRKPITE